MLNLIFFGSDQYSALVLKQLLDSSKVAINHVITTQPRPKGRKGIIEPNEVEKLAREQKLKVSYYPSNDDEMIKFIKELESNTIGLSASFPRLMPPKLLELFAGNIFNIHPSLLPQYRNVAPVPYALAMGDTVTGVSVFEIRSGIDSGPIVAQAKLEVDPTDTTPTLLNKLFTLGTDIFLRFLANPTDPDLTRSIPIMRSSDLIFTRKLTRESGFIEWPILDKLLNNKSVSYEESINPLINLRLAHHPDRQSNIFHDLIRALDGYERVWTTAPTKKGNVDISLSMSDKKLLVLIPGKPKPILWNDFINSYIYLELFLP